MFITPSKILDLYISAILHSGIYLKNLETYSPIYEDLDKPIYLL